MAPVGAAWAAMIGSDLKCVENGAFGRLDRRAIIIADGSNKND
jgi:hypothetical protein